MKIHPLDHSLFLDPSLHQIMFFNKRLLMFCGGINIPYEVTRGMLYVPKSMMHGCSAAVTNLEEDSGKANLVGSLNCQA